MGSLAERAHLSQRTISDLERGITTAPYRDTVALLADALALKERDRSALDDAVRVLDQHGIAHSEIRDLGEAFGICILVFRDPDNVQLELSGPRT